MKADVEKRFEALESKMKSDNEVTDACIAGLLARLAKVEVKLEGQKEPECTCPYPNPRNEDIHRGCPIRHTPKPKTATEAMAEQEQKPAMPLNAQVAKALGWTNIDNGVGHNLPWYGNKDPQGAFIPIPDYIDPANALRAFWTYIILNHLSAKIHIDPLGSGSIEISGSVTAYFTNFATPKDYCRAIVADYERRKA